MGMGGKGQGRNGWIREQKLPHFTQWIIPMSEDDATFITSPCQLLHETWEKMSDFLPGAENTHFLLIGYSFAKLNIIMFIVIREMRNVLSSSIYS